MMPDINYISYSGFKLFEGCPGAYWHQYVNKTKTPEPDDGLGSLYGSVVGLIFEAFYVQKLWKKPDCLGALKSLIRPMLDKAMQEQRKQGRVFKWDDPKALYPNQSALIEDVVDTLPRGLQTIKSNRLMGPQMNAEVKLDCRFGKYTIGGRADFVVQRVTPYSDLCILDGKGSKHREKYVDGHPPAPGCKIEGVQLKWYAFLYQERFKRTPDKLGYIFWKFGGDRAMEWVDFTQRDLDNLKREVLATVTRIDTSVQRLHVLQDQPQAMDDLRQELFITQPSHQCNLCSFSSICEDGKKKVKAHKKDRVQIPSGVDDFTL